MRFRLVGLVGLAMLFSFLPTPVLAQESPCVIGTDTWVRAIDQLQVDARWDDSDVQSAVYNPPDGYAIAETRVGVNSDHWGDSSVSTLAGDLKFASDETFESSRRYYLDVYGKYLDENGRKEFEGKLNQTFNSSKKYHRQFATNKNTVYAEVSARGSGNFFDQQGGWMNITVSARLVCVGSSNPEVLNSQMVSAVMQTVQFHRLAIKNQCAVPIWAWIQYTDPAGRVRLSHPVHVAANSQQEIDQSDAPRIAFTGNSIFVEHVSDDGKTWPLQDRSEYLFDPSKPDPFKLGLVKNLMIPNGDRVDGRVMRTFDKVEWPQLAPGKGALVSFCG